MAEVGKLTEAEKALFLMSARQSLPRLDEDLPMWGFISVTPEEVPDDRLGSLEVSWRTQAAKRGWKIRKMPNGNGRKFVRVPDDTPRRVGKRHAIVEMAGPGAEALAALSERQRGRYREDMAVTTGDVMCDYYNHRDAAEKIGDLEARDRYQALGDAEYARLEAVEKAEDAEYEAGVAELRRRNDEAVLYGRPAVVIPRKLEDVRALLAEAGPVVALASDAPAYDEDENGPDWSDLNVPDDDVGSDEVPV